MSNNRKVHAVFDNGSRLVFPSHFLLPKDGKIRDAVTAFKTKHAPLIWKCNDIELVGIVSEADMHLPYSKVIPSLTLEDFALQDMMEPKDFIVFKRAGAQQQAASMASSEEQSALEGEKSDTEEQSSDDDDEEASKRAHSAGTKTSQKSVAKRMTRQSRLARELQGLATFLPPPRVHKKHTQSISAEERPRKQARVVTPRRKKKPVGRPRKSKATSSSSASRGPYGVGTRHFFHWKSMDYPVKIQEPKKKLGPNERFIVFEGYGRRGARTVKTSDLLPVTPERDAVFLRAKSQTAEKELEKCQRQKMNDEKRTKERRAQREQARENERRQRKEEEAKREQHKKNLFGERIPRRGRRPKCKDPGTLFKQKIRRFYFAKDDETPFQIAEKFGVSVESVVYHNEKIFHGLHAQSPLKSLTAIILPPDKTGVDSSEGDSDESSDDESSGESSDDERNVSTESQPMYSSGGEEETVVDGFAIVSRRNAGASIGA